MKNQMNPKQYELYLCFTGVRPKHNPTHYYCQRCGIAVGERFQNTEIKEWKGFKLCEACYSDKIENKKSKKGDIEDLESPYKEKLIENYSRCISI